MNDLLDSITNSEEYYIHVMKRNRDAFNVSPEFVSIINLATSLYHFHERLFRDFKEELQQKFTLSSDKPRLFWNAVQMTSNEFGYMRAVANASKHVALSRKTSASTGIRQFQDLRIDRFGAGGFGQGPFGGGIVIHDGDVCVSFDACANKLFNYWTDLLQSLTGRS